MSNGEAKDKTTQIIVAIVGAIAVIAAALIGTMKGCSIPNGEKPLTLEIKQPASGNSVPASIKPNDAAAYFPVTGVLSGKLPKSNLGIYALVHDGGEWWVQSHAPAKEGAWNLEAWVGGEDNKPHAGQAFKLRAVLADIDTVEGYKATSRPVSEDASELNPVALSRNSPSVTLGSLVQK